MPEQEILVPAVLICDVPELKVKLARLFSELPKLKEVIATVEDPRAMVLLCGVLETRVLHVRVKFAVSNDPLPTARPLEPMFKASANAHSAPTPLTLMVEASATPFVVMVLPAPVPVSVIIPV